MNSSLVLLIALVIFLFVVYIVLSVTGSGGAAEWKIIVKNKSNKIRKDLRSNHSSDLERALIGADKLLDFALRHKGIKGNTLGERLKNAENHFEKKFYNSIWDAHKLRNKLVHEVDATLTVYQLRSKAKNLVLAAEKLV
ncbi:hypothetical protein KC669_02500 [Candidatus Dojkabacteria bacterium]|uniref:Uncharacterized protein n=1 Tax=Candidatus Dojkabacteria bacterium TaxID=2099670 RepID=A0A955LB14_9BACT|nr:hypothetical protein [Candidatus Dojkabacteria bacterium]